MKDDICENSIPQLSDQPIEVSNNLTEGHNPRIYKKLNFQEVSNYLQSNIYPIRFKLSLENLVNMSSVINELKMSKTLFNNDSIANSISQITKTITNYQATFGVSININEVNKNISNVISNSINNMIKNIRLAGFEVPYSPLVNWLKTIDFSMFTSITRNLRLGRELLRRYRELNEKYLKAMYLFKWFPYAAWIAERKLFTEINDILNSSRGVSKRCEKRIDKAIISSYTKGKIKHIKREWLDSQLQPHIKKALGQTLEAYLRKEYALVVPFLATIWEGIIKLKTFENTKKPKEDFKKLVDANGFNEVFSDFYNNMIIGTCYSVEDLIDGIPNRHSVAHSWYIKYPSQKSALNAILLTDFIIKLESKTIITEEK